MSSTLLIRRTLANRRTSLTWWAIGLTLYVGMILAIWPVIEDNEEFATLAESYPEGLQALFGGEEAFAAFTTPAGYLNTYLFTMFLPFILISLATAMASALLAGDEESGLLELVLSYPVTRTSAVVQKTASMVIALVGMGVLTDALIYGVGKLIDLNIGLGNLIAATIGTILIAGFSGQLSFAAGAVKGNKGFAMGVGFGVALIGYLFSVVASVAESLEWVQWASPFYYGTADDPLTNGMPAQYLVLVGGWALAFGATITLFRRHDIS